MKSEHPIHMKAKSERLICMKRVEAKYERLTFELKTKKATKSECLKSKK